MKKIIALFSVVLLMVGCASAPQQLVEFNSESIKPDQVIGIAAVSIPEPSLVLPGADCLLCIAAARAGNSALTSYSKTLDVNDIKVLPKDLQALLQKKGNKVKFLDEVVLINKLKKNQKYKKDLQNVSKKDHLPLKEKYGIDQLFVINLYQLGTHRPYASYIPTGAAQASIQGVSYLVDVQTNKYLWYNPISLYLSAEGEWKEPPEFPGLTNAYFQLIEQMRDSVMAPFK